MILNSVQPLVSETTINPGCECFSMVRDCGMVNEQNMADYLQQDSIEVLNVVG